MWQKIILIALAGSAGALARYGTGGLAHKLFGAGFPWGTLIVNVAGCFLFGLIWQLGQGRMLISPELRTILLVGFMGSFTTFSTFIFETNEMLKDSQWLAAVGNFAGQSVLGIGFLILGIALGRVI